MLFVPADEAVGGAELQIDVKPIGPEGKRQSQLKNKVSYLSVIGPDRRFIVFAVGLFTSHAAPCSAGPTPAFYSSPLQTPGVMSYCFICTLH